MRKGLIFTLLSAALLFFYSCATGSDHLENHEEITDLSAQGWSALWQNEFQEAGDLFGRVLELDPENTAALRGQGLVSFCSGREDSSSDSFMTAARSAPHSPLTIPVRDFVNREITGTRENLDRTESLNKMILESDSALWWMKREASAGREAYALQVLQNPDKVIEYRKELKALTEWSYLGPFSNISGSGFNKEFIDETASSISSHRKYYGINNQTLQWFEPDFQSLTHWTNAYHYFNYAGDSTVYAFREITVPEPGRFIFFLSQGGAVKVFLDGKPVLENSQYGYGQDRLIFTAELDKGKHALLVKVSNLDSLGNFGLSWQKVNGALEKQIRSGSENMTGLFSPGSSAAVTPSIGDIAAPAVRNEDSTEIRFWTVCRMQQKGFHQEAVSYIDNQVPEGQESSLFQYLKSESLRALGKETEAGNILREISEKETGFVPALTYRMKESFRNDNYHETVSTAEQILDLAPSHFEAQRFTFLTHASREEYEEGYEVLEDLLSDYPTTPAIYMDLLSLGLDEKYILLTGPLSDRLTACGVPGIVDEWFLDSGSLQTIKAGASKLTKLYPENSGYRFSLYCSEYDLSEMTYDDFERRLKALGSSYPNNPRIPVALRETYSNTLFLLKTLDPVILGALGAGPDEVDEYTEEEEENLLEVSEQLLAMNPADYSIRKEIRKLENSMSFDESEEFTDFSEIVSGYDPEEFRGTRDAAVLYWHNTDLFFKDGGTRNLYHKVLHVLSQEGVEEESTQYIPYNYRYDDLEYEFCRIIKADGGVQNIRRSGRRYSLKGLEPGDMIEIRGIINSTRSGRLNRDFWQSYTVSSLYPVLQRKISIIYPTEKTLNKAVYNQKDLILNAISSRLDENYTRQAYRIENIPAVEPEANMPDARDILCWIDTSTLEDWSLINEWYQDLYLGQCEVTPAVLEKALSLTEGLKDRENQIRALFGYVAGEIFYEDLAFQYSGQIPQKAESVMEDGFGDCKDKCTLLITLLKALGIDAHIALNEPGYAGENFFLPSSRFSHCLVIIPEGEHSLILDPTLDSYNYSELYTGLKGSWYLPVRAGEDHPGLQRIRENSEEQRTVIVSEVLGSNRTFSLNSSIIARSHYGSDIRSLLSSNNIHSRDESIASYFTWFLEDVETRSWSCRNAETLSEPPILDFKGILPSFLVKQSYNLYNLNLPWMVSGGDRFFLNSRSSGENGLLFFEEPLLNSPVSQTIIFNYAPDMKIISVPLTENMSFKDARAEYSYKIYRDRIVCTRELTIPKMYVNHEEMPEFREFRDFLRRKEKELVFVAFN